MLKIPFYKNPGEECLQACIKMVMAYYFPGKEIGHDEINKSLGRKKGKWTIPSQAAVALYGYGLKTKCFSSKDFPGNTVGEVKQSFKASFGKDYDKLEKHLDFEVFFNLHNQAKNKKLYEIQEHNWGDIVDYYNNGCIVIPVIDYNILLGKDGPYMGHFVLVTDINKESITIHDPDIGPNLNYKKSNFIRAFKAKEIDDDLLVVYSKL